MAAMRAKVKTLEAEVEKAVDQELSRGAGREYAYLTYGYYLTGPPVPTANIPFWTFVPVLYNTSRRCFWYSSLIVGF